MALPNQKTTKGAVSASSSPAVSSLSHPLPAGMRDLLPADAAQQGHLLGKILHAFGLMGYQRVALPVFEYADVLEKGLGAVPPTTLLRFVEPDTGEVVALRPDMTPQVARLAATRLASGPLPARLSYRGSVLRRRHERARHEQQVMQAGIELIGTSGLAADAEIIRTITSAIQSSGLVEYVLDLGHGGLAHELLGDLEPETKRSLIEALSLKDQVEVVRRAEKSGLPAARVSELAAVVELEGDRSVFADARKLLSSGKCLQYVSELEELYDELVRRNVAPRIVVDLGELRAVEYYTGPMFQILAEGPGQAVASGGRYDTLLGVFGADLPAAGGAIHVDHLRWAIGEGFQPRETRVLVVEPGEPGSAEAVASALREKGIITAIWSPSASARRDFAGAPSSSGSSSENALDYARSWRYSHLVRIDPQSPASCVLFGVEAEGEADLGALELESLIERLKA